jgi:serine/threonine protein kinase
MCAACGEEQKLFLQLHQLHEENNGSSSGEVLEPFPLQPGEHLQNVADSMVSAAQLQLSDARCCHILDALGSIQVDGKPGVDKIPLTMVDFACATNHSSEVSVIVVASDLEEERAASAWILLCQAAQLSKLCTLLSQEGAVRSDLATTFRPKFEIGSGSFANVVVGNLTSNDQLVVAKKLNDGCRKIDVEREVHGLVAAQGCANIIGYVGTYRDSDTGCWSILTECVASGDLCTLLQNRERRRLDESNAWSIANGLLNALMHLQSRKVAILHRDVKVENVLVQPNYNAKLCDFGLACFINQESELTRRCGSPGSTAPEMFTGTRITLKLDCFSLGVVIAHMLTGRSPFRSSSMEKTVQRNYMAKVDYTSRWWSDIGRDALDVIQALLKRKSEDRVSVTEASNFAWFQNPVDNKQKVQVSDKAKAENAQLQSDEIASERLCSFNTPQDCTSPKSLSPPNSPPPESYFGFPKQRKPSKTSNASKPSLASKPSSVSGMSKYSSQGSNCSTTCSGDNYDGNCNSFNEESRCSKTPSLRKRMVQRVSKFIKRRDSSFKTSAIVPVDTVEQGGTVTAPKGAKPSPFRSFLSFHKI